MSAFGEFDPSVEISAVQSEDVRMRVAQVGSGPDIVWVPGGDAPAEAWRGQMMHFSGRFRCTSYDPRGAGDTVAGPGPWRIADFARDCAAVIEQKCAAPVILTGLSMGALITQQVAIDFPQLVRLAIPMGTAAYIDGFTRDWMQAEIDLRRDGIVLPDYFLAPHYAAYALPTKSLGDPKVWGELKQAYTERFSNREPQDLIDQWQACLDSDCREGLRNCPVPIHVIAFSEDVQTPPAMGRVVADCARHGHFHEIAGLGHVSVVRDGQDIVNRKLAEIIAQVGNT